MRLAVIVPVLDRAALLERSLGALQHWRRRGHRVIVVDGGSRDGSTVLARPLADRVICAPRGWSLQANAGSRVAEAELADVLVFLPVGVQLPPLADRLIVRALSNANSPWGRFDLSFHRPDEAFGVLRGAAAALANLGSRATGICSREQAIFVARSAFLALEGFRAHDATADTEFCQRARLLGAPIALHPPARVPMTGQALGPLLAAVARREWRRLGAALGADTANGAWFDHSS